MPGQWAADVAVVGSGPAGWAVAHACCGLGLDTVVVAPRPRAVWRPTYGLWADQCVNLPDGAEVVRANAVWAGERRLSREYAVLDNEAVVTAYGRSPVRVVADAVVAADTGPRVTTLELRTGRRLAAGAVVDASGARRVLSGGPLRGARVEQTAYGVVVPAAGARPLVGSGDAVFMRWGSTGPAPTFLYAVPLPDGTTLLEETSLARRPGLPIAELRARLERRLAATGVPFQDAGIERVRFAMDLPMPRRRPGVVAFGVAAGMMHPATGYSVGEALESAPAVAAAIADDLTRGPEAAARAAHAASWPAGARVVRGLRFWGMRTLLSLPPGRVGEFFDGFFALPDELQRAYLGGRGDVAGTAAAMTAMFRTASGRLRLRLALGGVSRSA